MVPDGVAPGAARELSICFVSLSSFPLLSGESVDGYVGGAEVQQMHLARGLAARGYRVSFVVYDHGQEDGLEVGGIRVFKAYAPAAGIRGLRFVHPQCTALWRAMRRANADIYYQRMASDESGKACIWCRWRRRRYVFAAASDTNCDPRLPTLKTVRERILYRYALRRAHHVVVQTDRQQASLLAGFGRRSVVIPSCCPPAAEDPGEVEARQPPEQPRILWVGRLSPEKRPELCLELAEQMPALRFDIVEGSAGTPAYAAQLRSRASALPNVTLRGPVPNREMYKLYRGASLLLCTSLVEGFPNVFLEAWSQGRPVLSTVDPDGVIARHALGFQADGLGGLEAAALRLLHDRGVWSDCAQRALRYVREHHSIDSVLDAYERLLGRAESR